MAENSRGQTGFENPRAYLTCCATVTAGNEQSAPSLDFAWILDWAAKKSDQNVLRAT
jgi:hypothetical protein